MKPARPCACGCGQLTTPGKTWRQGHNVPRSPLLGEILALLAHGPANRQQIAKQLRADPVAVSSALHRLRVRKLVDVASRRAGWVLAGQTPPVSPRYRGDRVACACGCGIQILRYDDHGRERRFVHGHGRWPHDWIGA